MGKARKGKLVAGTRPRMVRGGAQLDRKAAKKAIDELNTWYDFDFLLNEAERLGCETLERFGWVPLGPKDKEPKVRKGTNRHRILLGSFTFVRDFSPPERAAERKLEHDLIFAAWALIADAHDLRREKVTKAAAKRVAVMAFHMGARFEFFDRELSSADPKRFITLLRRMRNLKLGSAAKKKKGQAADAKRRQLMSLSDEHPWTNAGNLARMHPGLGGQRAFFDSWKKRNQKIPSD